jgi:F-type H+-transporting ATPase subunit b
LEALGLNLGFLVLQILAFAIVFLTLQAWVYRPFLNMLETRRQKIAQSLEDARVQAEARRDAEREAAKIVAAAQAEASRIVAEATERAAGAAKDVKTAAEGEAARAREAAAAEAETERNRLLGDLRGQVAALAIAAAQKLVGETLDEKRQRALIDEFFSGVKSGKVQLLAVSGSVGAGTIKFRVDPAILGGLVIRVGDKVLDGSVAGRLEHLRQSLR